MEAFESKLLVEPNDVLALLGDELYVSNASGHHGVKRIIEHLFKKRWATVAHHRDKKWEVAADGIGFPNGLAVQADGKRLRVAAFNEKRLLSFERDPATGRLRRLENEAIRLEAHPDNLMPDGEDLLVAAHPNRRQTLSNIRDQRKPAPSAVYRVSPSVPPHKFFEDDGTRVAGSSTALIRAGVLYVSQVRRASLSVCPLSSHAGADAR